MEKDEGKGLGFVQNRLFSYIYTREIKSCKKVQKVGRIRLICVAFIYKNRESYSKRSFPYLCTIALLRNASATLFF